MNIRHMIKLTHCDIDSTVNKIFGLSIITQRFTNYFIEPIEVQIALPLCPEAIFHKFIIKSNGEEICSKIMQREVAQQKYFSSMLNNNIGIKGNYTNNNCYELSIGQVPANQEIVLVTYVVQLVELNDDFHSFSISPEILPYAKPSVFQFNNAYCDFGYNPFGNCTIRQVMPEANYAFNSKRRVGRPHYPPCPNDIVYDAFDMKIHITIQLQNGALISVSSPTNAINTSYTNQNTKASIEIMTQSKKPVEILFKTSLNNVSQLFEEYDPENDVYAYTLHYYYSKPLSPENKFAIQAPGQFYFLLDQSNSMKQERIKMAKEALLLFIQSLPINSKLGLIGFGSKYKEYSKGMSNYNQQTTNSLIASIKSLDANMQGTKLFEPLVYCIGGFDYNNSLCKHIFIVTDGIVFNPESCYNLALIHQNEFRIHAIGIGDSVDTSFLRKISRYGNGSTCHVKDVSTLNKDIIQILQKALKPYLNVNVIIDCDKIIEYPPSNSKRILFEHEFFNYSFITKTKLSDQIEIKVNAYNPITNASFYDQETILPIVKLNDGNVLNKAIVGTYLKQNKHIDYYTKTNLSIQYQVLSDVTSLFGEVAQKDKKDDTMNRVMFFSYVPMISNQVYLGRNIVPSSGVLYLDRNVMKKSGITSSCRSYNSKNSLLCKSIISNINVNQGLISNKNSNKHNENQKNKLVNKPAIKPTSTPTSISTMSNITMEKKAKKSNNHSEYNDIIESQNMFKGYWNDNQYTDKLITKYEKEYKEITALINKINQNIKTEKMKKIVLTYLVLFYIYSEHKEKNDELALIVNKGKQFLIQNGLKEDDFSIQ